MKRRILFFIIVALIGAGLFLLLRVASPSSFPDDNSDSQRLETLRSDPMYSVRYPGATELRRWEHGSRGFNLGVEDPPTTVYYAGTDDSDDKIIRFFIDEATTSGWYIFKGPAKLATDERVSVVFHKDNGGSLFVRVFEPEVLNRLLPQEKFPINHFRIFQVTLEAEPLER